MKKRIMWLTILLFLASISIAHTEQGQKSLPEIPTKGMVTMLDLGAHKCIPCKMMAPILEKLRGQYKGKASIIFVDVWKHREQAMKYGIRAIPTQIFYDKSGKEISRHVGFMSEEAIVGQLKKMGVSRLQTKNRKTG